MKAIRFSPGVQAEIRAIDREHALGILRALHHYAETGEGDVKALEGELPALRRLRVGAYRVLFEETPEAIRVHRVRHRREAYR